MNYKNIAIGGLALVALLFVYLYATKGVPAGGTPSGPIHYQGETFQGGIQIGQRGTFVTNVLSGTCTLSQSQAGSHAATTSKEYFCAVTGVQAGDLVIVDLPQGAGANLNGAGSIYGGFVDQAGYATTSNVIATEILNVTGAATSSFPQATTSAEYRVLR